MFIFTVKNQHSQQCHQKDKIIVLYILILAVLDTFLNFLYLFPFLILSQITDYSSPSFPVLPFEHQWLINKCLNTAKGQFGRLVEVT